MHEPILGFLTFSTVTQNIFNFYRPAHFRKLLSFYTHPPPPPPPPQTSGVLSGGIDREPVAENGLSKQNFLRNEATLGLENLL